MKCRQVYELIKKYADNRSADDKNMFVKVHMNAYESCKDELLTQEYIVQILNSKNTCKIAPDGFTDRVMKEVSNFHDEYNPNGQRYTASHSINPILKRVGASMVAAAFVMIFTMMTPLGKFTLSEYEDGIKTEREIYDGGVITNKFDSVDSYIKSLFVNINESIDRLKGD